MDKYAIWPLLLFIVVLISFGVLTRAKVKLDREKLLVVSQLNSINLRYLFAVILGIIIVALSGTYFKWINPTVNFYAIIFMLVAYAVLSFVLSLKTLKENNFSKSYINTYLFSVLIRIAAGALLYVFLIG